VTPQALAELRGICFDRACQDTQDQVFLAVVGIPLLCLAAAVLYQVFRKPPEEGTFQDPVTGTVFESTDGSEPERDAQGELAFRVQSYTPWPVDSDFEGERLRIPVGPVQNRSPRTYVFQRVLGASSSLLQVTLPRPMGIVFEEDAARRRVVVCAFVDGSHAAQMAKRASLDGSNSRAAPAAPAIGDVLRACTSTNIVYPQQSLFGAKPPERHAVLYGADQETWPRVMTALKKGTRDDGAITLVLERNAPLPLVASPPSDTTVDVSASNSFDPEIFAD